MKTISTYPIQTPTAGWLRRVGMLDMSRRDGGTISFTSLVEGCSGQPHPSDRLNSVNEDLTKEAGR